MALFPFCKTPTGAIRVSRLQLVLYCVLLSLIVYFLHGRKTGGNVRSPHPYFQAMELGIGRQKTDMENSNAASLQTPAQTPWGVPLVWGDNRNSVRRRTEFAQQEVRIGLLTLVVGTYAQHVRRFISSAEIYFIPSQMVTYYILIDNPRTLDPPIKLGPGRQLKVLPVAEFPGWDKLAYRRMPLLADAIKNQIGREVEYIFCADIDQEFMAPVEEEILGDLVATLHPELYGKPRKALPYENDENSSAYVKENEGDYYYTSELYGGLVHNVYRMALGCSFLILKDQANGITASGREESYLNRYLITHRPTCVLSPEYSWWDSGLAIDVPEKRLVSLGRQCEAFDAKKREKHRC
ncbi:globoside alpha-1,3-N-acetylgalactosaminyltransferase 1-like isoform X1 [Syngnathoides biaculeatus]|uniref:globoside alpha-1,3-N-acetylgalactosaminyltransferase 1-like isoform X1 n=2 Tax=Syngnathoides biaculeatus TaxID=300417 RepID=UPI002ADD6EC8|nr:globoside alpha-1,3-N-acetylgalactosaminyltransferase 1-like isoform X1 [Syngnathoides biaculeatus]XP_061688448.1 globoside alpha-1,3-N-acetylgalactosaminyltransferase 1-like isoform X1 [Syngnathoides biaculeatus]XP_061688449.1 globoside alpha-1,3-N-acetylgalactosaminyltransferase 1-like isoform X1 [Syngnathoides biaculeatus]XP_061688450.1 globoside alpha-1,3-N-acetylgalactosaminyltransferase 1-like isoform X1 [Syngnathoides biaculeatus]